MNNSVSLGNLKPHNYSDSVNPQQGLRKQISLDPFVIDDI